MQFSTPPRKEEIKSNSVSLLVSLFLILLTIFIILSSKSSYDPNKQSLVKQSVEDKFGKKNKQALILGRQKYLKLDDHAIELEKVVKKYGTVATNNDEDKLRISIPLDNIYYSDEPGFRSNVVDDMMLLMRIIRTWTDSETVHISVSLAETNLKQDEKRLDFFEQYIQVEKPLIGLKVSTDKTLDIIIERVS